MLLNRAINHEFTLYWCSHLICFVHTESKNNNNNTVHVCLARGCDSHCYCFHITLKGIIQAVFFYSVTIWLAKPTNSFNLFHRILNLVVVVTIYIYIFYHCIILLVVLCITKYKPSLSDSSTCIFLYL